MFNIFPYTHLFTQLRQCFNCLPVLPSIAGYQLEPSLSLFTLDLAWLVFCPF